MSPVASGTNSLRQACTFTYSRKNIAFRNSARLTFFNRFYQKSFLRRIVALFPA